MNKTPQTKILETTSKMLSGEINYLQGALDLVVLRNEVGAYENDPDFIAFIAVKMDLDHQPFETESDNWVETASSNFPEQLKASHEWAKQTSWQPCINLNQRYGG